MASPSWSNICIEVTQNTCGWQWAVRPTRDVHRLLELLVVQSCRVAERKIGSEALIKALLLAVVWHSWSGQLAGYLQAYSQPEEGLAHGAPRFKPLHLPSALGRHTQLHTTQHTSRWYITQ